MEINTPIGQQRSGRQYGFTGTLQGQELSRNIIRMRDTASKTNGLTKDLNKIISNGYKIIDNEMQLSNDATKRVAIDHRLSYLEESDAIMSDGNTTEDEKEAQLAYAFQSKIDSVSDKMKNDKDFEKIYTNNFIDKVRVSFSDSMGKLSISRFNKSLKVESNEAERQLSVDPVNSSVQSLKESMAHNLKANKTTPENLMNSLMKAKSNYLNNQAITDSNKVFSGDKVNNKTIANMYKDFVKLDKDGKLIYDTKNYPVQSQQIKDEIVKLNQAKTKAIQTTTTAYVNDSFDSITKDPSESNLKKVRAETITNGDINGIGRKRVVSVIDSMLGKNKTNNLKEQKQIMNDSISNVKSILSIPTNSTVEETNKRMKLINSDDFKNLYSKTIEMVKEVYKDRPNERDSVMRGLNDSLNASNTAISEVDRFNIFDVKNGKQYTGYNSKAKKIIDNSLSETLVHTLDIYKHPNNVFEQQHALDKIGNTISSIGSIPKDFINSINMDIGSGNSKDLLEQMNLLNSIGNNDHNVKSLISKNFKLSAIMEATSMYTNANGVVDMGRLSPILEKLQTDDSFIKDKQSIISKSIKYKFRNQYSPEIINAVSKKMAYDNAFTGNTYDDMSVAFKDTLKSLTTETDDGSKILDISSEYNPDDINTLIKYYQYKNPDMYKEASKFYIEVQPESGATNIKYDGVVVSSSPNKDGFNKMIIDMSVARKQVLDEEQAVALKESYKKSVDYMNSTYGTHLKYNKEYRKKDYNSDLKGIVKGTYHVAVKSSPLFQFFKYLSKKEK